MVAEHDDDSVWVDRDDVIKCLEHTPVEPEDLADEPISEHRIWRASVVSARFSARFRRLAIGSEHIRVVRLQDVGKDEARRRSS